MKGVNERELRARLRAQHSLVHRSDLRLLGVTAEQERRRVANGEWELAAPGVIRLAGSVPTPEQELMAACLGAGPSGVASHQSAAWMWSLLDQVPSRHAVTVARGATVRLHGVDVHHPVDYPGHVVTVRRIPCTNPLRTVVDLAAVCPTSMLDAVIDRAVASRLLGIDAIEAEAERLSRKGRVGVGVVRDALRRRGFVGAPHPSVLESRTLRLLHQFGIVPLSTEVHMGPGGRYRVDIVLAPDVIMEVDGFAHHADPEQMSEDKRRRTQMRLGGTTVLEYTWRDIVYDSRRVIGEVRQALAASLTRRAGRLGQERP